MKSLTSLWSCVANEMATRCCTSATLDIKYVERRVEHEGLSFLAITLADFGKLFQRWLDQGHVVPSECRAMKNLPGSHTGLPAFLSGFLARVFDSSSGALLDDPDIEAIFAVLQLTLLFSKIALPEATQEGKSHSGGDRKVVSPKRERLAMSEFIQCEQDVKAFDSSLSSSTLDEFRVMSNMLFGDVFAKIELNLDWGFGFIPKHGPGAVADKLSSNGKYDLRTWTARLQDTVSWEHFLCPNPSYKEEMGEEVSILEPGAEMPVRVITVPKTLKTPRIIAIEPAAMQYVQQSLLSEVRYAFSEDSFLSRVIGFDDQEPNRFLARKGSLCGDLATLDLSEASDRVSNQHVRAMLSDFPHLSALVDATRSRKADVPGHGVIRLSKFASMGSALCFPMEAMVFLTLIFLGISRESSAPLSRDALIKRYRKQVRVFGDDLIVPVDNVLSVVNELSTFGYKVNVGKSFWTGRFRESCGRMYYNGQDVSIVKVRQVLPTQRQNASGVIAAVSLRNHLYMSGTWQGARWLDDYLGRVLKHFPNVAPTSSLQGRVSFLGYQFQRLDPHTHGPLTKGYYVRSVLPRDHLEGPGALLKCLLRNAQRAFNGYMPPRSEPCNAVSVASVDDEHLERSGRPEHVSIKLGWRSPF